MSGVADIPRATTAETVAARTTDVVIDTPEGPRAYTIRKSTGGDMERMQAECYDPVTKLVDLVPANLLAVELCCVDPAFDADQVREIPKVIWQQLVDEIATWSGKTVEEMATPDPEEGSREATQFPAPGTGSEGDGAHDDVGAGEVAPTPES